MNRILEKQLAYDMDRLKADFRLMTDMVHLGLTEAVEALKERDRKKAYGVILRDSRVDNLESVIDKHCLEFLVKHSPMAAPLRFVYSAAKMGSEVERVGDYAEAIARQAVELSYRPPHPVVADLVKMADIAISMFQNASHAFIESDVDLATKTLDLDKRVNAFQQAIYNRLTSGNIGDTDLAKQVYSLLQISNRLERVADQSCNICEEAIYIMTGEMLKHQREKEFNILFVSGESPMGAQMAKAIGREIASQERFTFTSVSSEASSDSKEGLHEFFEAKGIRMNGDASQLISELENLEKYDVVVTLGQKAATAFPKLPFKTVALNWEIGDLNSHSDKQRAFQRAYDLLEMNIRDLISALEGQ